MVMCLILTRFARRRPQFFSLTLTVPTNLILLSSIHLTDGLIGVFILIEIIIGPTCVINVVY